MCVQIQPDKGSSLLCAYISVECLPRCILLPRSAHVIYERQKNEEVQKHTVADGRNICLKKKLYIRKLYVVWTKSWYKNLYLKTFSF